MGGGGYGSSGLATKGGILGETSTFTTAIFMGFAYFWYLANYSILITDSLKKYVKYCFIPYVLLGLIAAVGTEARTGLVVLAILITYLFFTTKKKLMIMSCACLLAFLAISFTSQSWKDRMLSIKTYEHDNSANNRILAWKFAINFANDHPIFGGGYGAAYFNSPTQLEPHSIFFEVLSEQGYVGLFYYLSMLLGTWFLNHNIMKKAMRLSNEYEWLVKLCYVNSFAFLAFIAGGLFLNLSRNLIFYIIFMTAYGIFMITRELELKPQRKGLLKNNTI